MGEGGTALSELLIAIRKFQARDDRRVDLKALREVIDGLKVALAFEAHASQVHPRRAVDPNHEDRS
jgi:hypothetical protein